MRQFVCYVIGVVALLSVAANIVLFNRTKSYQNDIAIKEQIISDIGINSHLISYSESNILWNLRSERFDISELRPKDTLGTNISLNNIAQEPILVYRFRDLDCQECVNFGLRKLEIFARDSSVRVVILAQYHDPFIFKRWWRTTSEGRIGAFNVMEDLPQDKMSMPYFFMLHPDLTMGELFIPDKANPSYTSQYFKIISEKYFR